MADQKFRSALDLTLDDVIWVLWNGHKAYSDVKHAVNNTFATLMAISEISTKFVPPMKKAMGKRFVKRWAQAFEYIEALPRVTLKRIPECLAILQVLSERSMLGDTQIPLTITVKPAELIREIKTMSFGLNVKLSSTSARNLEFLFLRETLYFIFLELIHNAYKADAKCIIYVSWRVTGGAFCCRIQDTGPGIVPTLSSKFVQLAAIRTQLGRGEGLDLTASRVRYAQGTLLFRRSKRHKGTEAYLKIPMKKYVI